MKPKTLRSLIFLFWITFFTFTWAFVPSSFSQDLPYEPKSELATIYVDPSTATGAVGTNITFNLKIMNASDVFAWQVGMKWNLSVLKFVELVKGDFLNIRDETVTEEIPDEDVEMRLTVSKKNEYLGSFLVYRLIEDKSILLEDKSILLIGETLLGEVPGMSGNGTLCSVVFQVVASGESEINVDAENRGGYTVTVDSSLNRVVVATKNGFFRETNYSENDENNANVDVFFAGKSTLTKYVMSFTKTAGNILPAFGLVTIVVAIALFLLSLLRLLRLVAFCFSAILS